MIAVLAVHDKTANDAVFEKYLSLVERESSDPRNYVKKTVNWALRQIGKRSPELREKAVGAAERIRDQDTKSTRWIANDALRELTK